MATTTSSSTSHYGAGSMTMAAENRQSTRAITHATELMQQHVESLLLLLDDRAAAYAWAARFDWAVRDAELMQMLAPLSALGYARAGDVYAQQGKQLLAMEAYTKGLRVVAASKSGYEQLVKGWAAAQAHCNTKVDMIRMLPVDVVTTNILPRMLADTPSFDSNNLCAYLDVSDAWRERINQYNATRFSAVYDHLAPRTCRFDRGHRQLIRCAPYVASLQIKPEAPDAPGRSSTSIFPRQMLRRRLSMDDDDASDAPYYAENIPAFLLTRARFDSLMNLSIDDRISRTSFLTVLALSWVGKTLTHLDIHCNKLYLSKAFRLCDIMTACPHLISLTAAGAEPDMSAFPWEYRSLKHLALPRPAFPIGNDKLMSIISRIPMIESLKLDRCPESQGLAAMHAYCPSLKKLHYSTRDTTAFDALPNMQPKEEHAVAALHEFRVSDPWSARGSCTSWYEFDDLALVLAEYNSMLEAFYCHGGLGRSSSTDNRLEFVRFHRLRHLVFCNGNESSMQLAIQMIQNATQLASAFFTADMVSNAIINALAQLDALSTLWLDGVVSIEHDEALLQLFSRAGAGGHRLRNVRIAAAFNVSTYPPWLQSLASMAQLRTLRFDMRLIGNYPSERAGHPFRWLIASLARHCPAIEHLELGCKSDRFTTRIFAPLAELTRLKHLIIKASSFADGTLLDLQQCSSLARLEIYMLSPVPHHVVQRLRGHVPDVIAQYTNNFR